MQSWPAGCASRTGVKTAVPDLVREAHPAVIPAFKRCAFSAALFFSATVVQAADKISPVPMATAVAGPVSLFKELLALFLVLGLIMAAAWAVKRFAPKTLSGSAAVRIVGGVSLGGRERIVIVETGDQWIVVGVAPGRVNALSTMPKQAMPATPESPLSGKNFSDWLKQTIDKRNSSDNGNV